MTVATWAYAISFVDGTRNRLAVAPLRASAPYLQFSRLPSLHSYIQLRQHLGYLPPSTFSLHFLFLNIMADIALMSPLLCQKTLPHKQATADIAYRLCLPVFTVL